MSDAARAIAWAEQWAPNLAREAHGDPFVAMLAAAGAAFAADKNREIAALQIDLEGQHGAYILAVRENGALREMVGRLRVTLRTEHRRVHIIEPTQCQTCALIADPTFAWTVDAP